MRTRAAGFADGAEAHASSRRDRIPGTGDLENPRLENLRRVRGGGRDHRQAEALGRELGHHRQGAGLQDDPRREAGLGAGGVERHPHAGTRGRLTSGTSRSALTVMASDAASGWPESATATSSSSTMTAVSTPAVAAPAAPIRARSSWPWLSSPISWSELSSVRTMLTPGYARWNPASSSVSEGQRAATHHAHPDLSAHRAASSSTASRAFATALPGRPGRTAGTVVPTSVSRTERPERSSSGWPSSDSHRRTCALTPGCATCRLVAASSGEAGFFRDRDEVLELMKFHNQKF